jgi:hypothetical protein
MRALAVEARVGFANYFNYLGSKNAIMQALSSRLIERMVTCFRYESPDGDAIDRVLAMGRISFAHLLEKPEVHKAVFGSLGVFSPIPGSVRRNARNLWSAALGNLAGRPCSLNNSPIISEAASRSGSTERFKTKLRHYVSRWRLHPSPRFRCTGA